MNNLINFIAFQIIWFLAVLGAANNNIWPAGIALVVFMSWQLSKTRRHKNDKRFVVFALVIGLILDSAWQLLGYIQFKTPLPYFSFISPLWILFLWIAFALTFNHSMSWLKKSPILAVIFGFIGAPLSYLAGLKIDALIYLQGPVIISLLIGTTWACVLFFFTQYQHIYSKLVSNTHTHKS
jgi:hypothetical protein